MHMTGDTKEFPPPRPTVGERAKRLLVPTVILFAALAARLLYLAAFDKTSVETLNGQYSRRIDVVSRTGLVFDRDGIWLSHTVNGAAALVDPAAVKDKNALFDLLKPTEEDAFRRKLGGSTPFTLSLEKMPPGKLPEGVYAYETYEERSDGFLRHLLGARDGDGRGVSGVYGRFDDLLKSLGASVVCRYEADASESTAFRGSVTVTDNGYGTPAGLRLTVREDMQKALETACADMTSGCAVVCDAETGELLALLSRPLYDADNVAAYLDSPRGELINRAFETYAPGAFFGLVTAAAALEGNGSAAAFTCRCRERNGHGEVDMKKAFAASCDTFFLDLGARVGKEEIRRHALTLGFGSRRVLGGMAMKAGVLPGDEARIAVGEGVTATPFDMLSAVIAAYTGFLPRFTLLYGIQTDGGLTRFDDQERTRLYADETVATLRKLLRACVTEGEGRGAYIKEVYTAGLGDGTNHLFAGVFGFHGRTLAAAVLSDTGSILPEIIFRDTASLFAALPPLAS